MKKQKNSKKIKLYCFSPLVMITTFALEFFMAIWVYSHYRASLIRNLSIITLLSLGTFQLAEYNVCTGSGQPLMWSRIGFIAITLLPPLGLHLASILSGKGKNLVKPAYIAGGSFALFFGFAPTAINSAICTGNYVIFSLMPLPNVLYAIYYHSLLWLAIVIALQGRKSASKEIKPALTWLVIGYLCFILPTGLINAFKPETIKAMPSIMCGFALIFAFILTLKVMPAASKFPRQNKNLRQVKRRTAAAS